MNCKNKFLNFLENKFVLFGLIFFISLTLFGWLQADYTFADPDSFYHTAITKLISQQGIIFNFPWLSQTALKENFTDQHLLYHLFLVPFIKITDPWLGIKIATSIFNALLLVFLAFYLRQRQVKHCWAYLLLLLTIGPFIVRLSLPKATPLALILLFLGIYLFEEKKYLWLFLVSFLYVWAHGGFLLLLIAAVIFYIIEIIYNKIKHVETRLIASLRGILTIITGTIAGIIINPYFPHNLFFYWQQVIQIGLINYKDQISVGAEWYSYQIPDLVGATSLVWILVVGAVLIFIFYFKKQKVRHLQWLTLALFFLIATVRSRRFVEYFVPTMIIWTSLMISWFLASSFWWKFKSQFLVSYRRKKWLWNILFVYLTVAISLGIGHTVYSAKQALSKGFAINYYQAASEYLQAHTNSGDVVFHASWDDFPLLFYYNQYNNYLIGLDATFMYKYNKDQYKLWRDIGQGHVKDHLGEIIKDKFHARYIFIDHTEEGTKLFRIYLERDKSIKKVFHDDRTAIYEIP